MRAIFGSMAKARMQKEWARIAAGIAALFVLVAILVSLVVNADTFRPTVETELSGALGRPITLGHLSFSAFKGSLVARDISIADDPAFSTTPFLEAKSLDIGVEVVTLIVHRRVRITHLTIDAPAINLLHGQNGRWNFSSLGSSGTTAGRSSQSTGALPNLTLGKLNITHGSATVSSIPAARKPLVYSQIDVSVQQFSFLKPFSFQMSATLPASGSFKLNGSAGPLSQKNAADTPFQATLELKGFDPVAAGILDPSAGISMSVGIDAQLVSDGTSLITRGKVQADRMQLARTGSPSPHPVDIDYEVTDHLEADSGQISNISIHAGAVVASITGTYQLAPQSPLLDLHLSAPGLPVDQIEQLLPSFGVRLPTGSRLSGGTLTANLTVNGPAAATTVTGPIEIDKTTLLGFDLGSRIQGLNLFKSGSGTQIETARATVNSSEQTTQFSDIFANLPQLGTATGSGAVSPSGALDFKMIATLNSSNAVGAVANQTANAVSGVVGTFLHSKAKPSAKSKRGIPVAITGSASSPTIRANVLSMFK
jgi:AsmA protein